MHTGKILIVDDDRNLLELVRTRLEAAKYEVVTAVKGEEAKEALNGDSIDLSIVDLKLAGQDGMSLMGELHAINPALPIIILTGYGSIEGAVEAIKRGAYGYLTKPIDPTELQLQIGRALENRRLVSENVRLKELLKEKYDFTNIVAKSDIMQKVLAGVSRIAQTESTVHIHGESGTGKEVIAKAIHLASERKNKPFVAINCAAVPEALLESELFGHEKGSFTGAVRSTKGYFAQAHEGTILLDEIGDMPLSIQPKLLRALEERQFYPIGSEKPIHVDVRVIVATKKDLAEEVRKGLFREDLFYRIHVIPVRLPPLRERKEDIPHLVSYLLQKIARQLKKDIKGLTPQAMKKLMLHDWPGNVRELENTLEYAVTMAEGEVVTEGLLFETRAQTAVNSQESALRYDLLPVHGPHKSLKEARAEFEKTYLVRLLRHSSGSAAKAAEIAGKYRADFYDLLKKHGINLQEFKKAD
jgi:two-component system response regulator GlrR